MIRIILVCILLVILLVSCGGGSEGQVKVAPNLYLTEIDGMPCVIYSGYKSGGVTCDWTRYTGAK